MKMSVAIVGASAAGVAAALALREQGFDGTISLIGAENRLPYDRPAVSKDILLTGAVPLIVPASAYEDNRIELRTGVRVTSLETRTGTMMLDDGTQLRADKVLLATGGRVRQLAVPGASLDRLYYVRSADDAEAIRRNLRAGARVAVIGGGLIGAEVAASAIQAGCSVDWIEAGFRCLTRALSHPFDTFFMDLHRQKGVRIHLRSEVARILGDAVVTGVALSDGRRIDADMVVVGIGIVPETRLAEASGIHVNNGIVVDEYCMTSAPNVYAAGDVARHQTRYMSAPGRLEHWRHAQEHGAAAAAAMLGHGQPYAMVPWFWTDQYEHHFEGCGLPQEGDVVVLRGVPAEGSASAFYLRSGRLSAAASLNRPNDVRGAMRLIASGLAVSAEALRDPECDLRKLEKELKNVQA
ncbi:FAD-dependent oxidoreductase [Pseudomonas sp. S 311-6]|nr:FAD-dependent oxidoreductase [Pseudomonas sp. S 311-6]